MIEQASRLNRPFETEPIVVYHCDHLVYHTTNARAADAIRQHGFLTGKALDVNERRGAVFFAIRAFTRAME